ncbi:WbuC family cupin fold metalloprotein [Motilimonas cestriensis]|uniref:WbuC family cupin fold metalloprotein n=1 Tax=Motilimonas cestriensis TaxID=2742685 RepID=A0ABS8W7I8_9GAMM|nr:WbuC family cupin fold metalloprotein [Motilimonas cestriensis]MCE2594072.1 WbuC family cupin fold metalloprotein [Motilimonas cestriensis]
MRTFGSDELEYLFQQAELSQRARAHLNLHQSYDDKVQRLYIAMLKGSYVEPHFHELPHQWEMFMVVQGVINLKLYHLDGSEKASLFLGEGHDIKSMELHPNEIHSVECISDKALLLEIKEGPFDVEYAKKFPSW